jgi:hypothetical protein
LSWPPASWQRNWCRWHCCRRVAAPLPARRRHRPPASSPPPVQLCPKRRRPGNAVEARPARQVSAAIRRRQCRQAASQGGLWPPAAGRESALCAPVRFAPTWRAGRGAHPSAKCPPYSGVQGKLGLAAAAVLAVLLFARYEHTLGLAGSLWGSSGRARLVAFDEVRTLQFDVCNGFTNQRIALMSGGPASQPASQPNRPAICCPCRHPSTCHQQPLLPALLPGSKLRAGATRWPSLGLVACLCLPDPLPARPPAPMLQGWCWRRSSSVR